MKAWKKFLTTGVLAAAAVSLAACSGGSGSSDSGKETLTIGYWKGSDTENAALDTLIKQFEEDNGVKVESKVYTDITTQLPTDLAGGTAPDVFYIDSSFYPYLQGEGVLNDISDVVSADDYYETLASAFSTDGKLYAAPKDVSTLAIYANTAIFEKAGIALSEVPTSYEEFIKWAPGAQEKIDAAYGKGQVYLMNLNADLARNWPYMVADDQNPIEKDGTVNTSNPTIVKNLMTAIDLFNTGAVATPQQVGAGDEGAGFGTGKFALALTGNWNYQVFKTQYKDLKFEVLPNMTYKGEKVTMQFTVGWGQYKNTKVKDLADKWIQFVGGKEGMSSWTEAVGTLATRPDVAESSKNLAENPALQVHQDAIEYAIAWQNGTNLATLQSSYGNFISEAFKKGAAQADLEAALKQVDEDANSKIKK